VLEQLDQSAFLLMYLADELPAGERAQVEQLLASDASLRQEFETLRSAQDQFVHQMASADATASTLGEASSINRITRAMRQHQVRRVLTPAAETPRSVHFWARVPRWGYPIAAAAAVALVYVGYWTIKAPDPTRMGGTRYPFSRGRCRSHPSRHNHQMMCCWRALKITFASRIERRILP